VPVLIYPVELMPDDNGTVMVTFPDIPEAVTYGEDEDEALLRAVDALEAMLAAYMDDRQAIPKPSPLDGRKGVLLPVLTSAKVMLYMAMREAGVKKAQLARRMGIHASQADRLLNLDHASRIEEIERAFNVLGKRLILDMEEAA
jgi:antitoxin HicB